MTCTLHNLRKDGFCEGPQKHAKLCGDRIDHLHEQRRRRRRRREDLFLGRSFWVVFAMFPTFSWRGANLARPTGFRKRAVCHWCDL